MSGTIGRYQILSRLGPPQDNEVYKGFDPMIEREIVVKVFSLAKASAATVLAARQVFFEDIQRASTLDHPGIVTIFDVGELTGGLFLATEYVEGSSLSAALSAGLHLPFAARVSVIAQIGDALEYAQERGVPHLAVEPTNVLIGHDASLKIRGFGEERFIQTLTSDDTPGQPGDPAADYRRDAVGLAHVARVVLGDLWDTAEADAIRPVVVRGLADGTPGFETAGAFRQAFMYACGIDDFDVRMAWNASHWMTTPGARPAATDAEPSTDETRLIADAEPSDPDSAR